jgi:hypothetical protein
MWVRTAACLSALLALGAVASGSAGAVTITSWIGGKGATPDIVTAGGGACPGTMTTINGSGFVSEGVTGVTIGGVPSSEVIVGSDIILYARVGPGATDGSVAVTTRSGTATATMKVNVVPCQSTATAATKPAIESLKPQKTKAGKKLTIHGSGFVGMTSVKVGGVSAAYAIPSDNLMYVTMPADAKAGQLAIILTNTLGKAAGTVFKSG